MRLFSRAAGIGQIGAIDPARTVHGFGGHGSAHHGPRAACIHGKLWPPGQVPHPPRISLGLRQGHIPGNCSDAEQVELLGRCDGHQQGDSVVLARITVDDQWPRTHASPRPAGRTGQS